MLKKAILTSSLSTGALPSPPVHGSSLPKVPLPKTDSFRSTDGDDSISQSSQRTNLTELKTESLNGKVICLDDGTGRNVLYFDEKAKTVS